jgi:hypothetical protein
MSTEEQDLAIGKLVREHRDRKHQFVASTIILTHIGESLRQAGTALEKLNFDAYDSVAVYAAEGVVKAVQSDVDLSALHGKIQEYGELMRRIVGDQKLLDEYKR